MMEKLGMQALLFQITVKKQMLMVKRKWFPTELILIVIFGQVVM